MGQVFVWLMSFLGVGAGWMAPFVGLMVYYSFSILRPTYLWFWSFDPYTAPRFSKYIALSTLAGWAFTGFGDWSGLRGTKIAIFGLSLYFIAGLFAHQMYSQAPQQSWNALELQLKIGVMALATLTLVRDARSIRIFMWVLIASLGFTAYTINEWYQISPMYLHNNGFGAIDNNGVGMIMVCSVPLAFFMAVYDRRIWVKALCFFAVACEVHVILFSFSRGSQLGLCIVGAFIFFFAMTALPRKLLTLFFASLFVVVTLVLAGDGVRERFMSIFAEDLDSSAESRFTMWKAGWDIMMDHPLGVGPRNTRFYTLEMGLGSKSIHNLYLQTGADYGIFGLIGLTLFYLSTFFQCLFMAFRPLAKKMVWPFYIGVGVCTSLGGFLVCSFFIGMESVEVGFLISLAGLSSVAYLNRVAAATPAGEMAVPELLHVPKILPEYVPA
jgi:putative inorganic carbon (hco3(-)) transporter